MLSDYMHVSHNKLGTTKSCTQLLRNHQDMTGWMLNFNVEWLKVSSSGFLTLVGIVNLGAGKGANEVSRSPDQPITGQ